MAVVTTKSPSIINLDSQPIIANTTGEAGPGNMRVITDNITAVVGDSIASLYKIIRVPTNAKIKKLLLNYPGSTAGAGDFDVFFSDSNFDGTQPSLAGGVVQLSGPVDNKLFGAAITLIGAAAQKDLTFLGTFTQAHQNLPLWQVLVNLGATQFLADPGGFFDIGVKLTTALTVTAGVLALEANYVE